MTATKDGPWESRLSDEERVRMQELRMHQREMWGIGLMRVPGWGDIQGYTEEQLKELKAKSNI